MLPRVLWKGGKSALSLPGKGEGGRGRAELPLVWESGWIGFARALAFLFVAAWGEERRKASRKPDLTDCRSSEGERGATPGAILGPFSWAWPSPVNPLALRKESGESSLHRAPTASFSPVRRGREENTALLGGFFIAASKKKGGTGRAQANSGYPRIDIYSGEKWKGRGRPASAGALLRSYRVAVRGTDIIAPSPP